MSPHWVVEVAVAAWAVAGAVLAAVLGAVVAAAEAEAAAVVVVVVVEMVQWAVWRPLVEAAAAAVSWQD